MSRHMAGRPALAIAILLLLTAVPETASAQFGRLKKLKNAVSPDSAAKAETAKADSIAIAAKLAVGDTTPLERSRFSRAVKAAGAGAEKFENVTGVSVKDAALAATGVGATGLVAKKLGVDPKTILAEKLGVDPKAILAKKLGVDPQTVLAKKLGVDPATIGANAVDKAFEKRGLNKGGVGGMLDGLSAMKGKSGAKGMEGLPDMGELMKMQQAAMKDAAKRSGADLKGQSIPGFTEADVQALAAFQQEMMQVAMAASAGDVAAQARLNRWEGIALKYQPEMERITRSATPGDLKALQRLQEIQILMLKEWVATGTGKVKGNKR